MIFNMIESNICPYIPKNATYVYDSLQKLARGASVKIYNKDNIMPGVFNTGQEYLLASFEERQTRIPEQNMPALWMLAHAYMGSKNARYFLDTHLLSTSSSRRINKRAGVVQIAHSIRGPVPDKGKIELAKYGIVIPVRISEYPKEDVALNELIEKYPLAAQALFLMNDSQLEVLANARQGAEFIDSQELRINPFDFGGRIIEGHDFFGVTCEEYVPVSTFPVSMGSKNEISRTFSPQEHLKLTETYERIRKSPTPANIKTLGKLLEV
jgi:hypothetical protein